MVPVLGIIIMVWGRYLIVVYLEPWDTCNSVLAATSSVCRGCLSRVGVATQPETSILEIRYKIEI